MSGVPVDTQRACARCATPFHTVAQNADLCDAMQAVVEAEAHAETAKAARRAAQTRFFQLVASARPGSMRSLAASIGVTPGYLSRLERGRKTASLELIRRIAEELGVSE